MKIVFPDRETLGYDTDLSIFNTFGEVIKYDYTSPEDMPERVIDADILILNKVPVNKKTCGSASKLKLVSVTATGTNNLDKKFLSDNNIEWRNVAGYSTESVVQHTFALFFSLYEKLPYYDDYVKSGKYSDTRCFTHFGLPFSELSGKTWGIIGLGTIGHRVAEVAGAFGCNIIYYSTSGKNHDLIYKEVKLDELLSTSDVISIHAPLNDATMHLINQRTLSQMKKNAFLINVSRGPIIIESDLANAIEKGIIAGAGLDVFDSEPISCDNPLLKISHKDRLIMTPHIAWASNEARNRLMKTVFNQIDEFLKQKS